MQRAILFLLLSILLLQSEGQPATRITILHTNDLHSRLTGYAPESAYTPLAVNDDSTTGGFARIAGIIKSEKESNDGVTLVLDAGDFLMGTLFPGLESATGFQLRLMRKMGYDVVGLGNHEFDFGPEWLAGVISTSAGKGDIPSLLSSNIIFDEKAEGDDSLEKLFTEKLIARKLVVERAGVRIGLFSIFGRDAERVAPKATPLTFGKQVTVAREMVKELKNEKCGIIICVSHSGISEKSGEWTGGDVELAKKVKGLSLIVGGHSHTRLDQPVVINGIPIVQAGEFGKFVGSISFVLSNGKLSMEKYRLIPVDDKVVSEREIDKLIEEQKEKISSGILDQLGLSYESPVAETSFIIAGNDTGDFEKSNLGPFVADAIHYYVNSHGGRGTDISMVAAGMLFDKMAPGLQTAPDIFRVMPLGSGSDNVPGYPLSRLYVTGRELKNILEILQVAYKSAPDNYCYYSGIRVELDPGKGLFRKIKKIGIFNSEGTIVNVDYGKKNSTLYSITANSYMLEFIGIIKKMSFGIINVVPKDSEGNPIKDMKSTVIDIDDTRDGIQEGKEWLAMIAYFRSMKDTSGDGIPDIDTKYAGAVRSFFPVSSK
jgi:5'-nucleotidase / UDP-sugar diphosphatase